MTPTGVGRPEPLLSRFVVVCNLRHRAVTYSSGANALRQPHYGLVRMWVEQLSKAKKVIGPPRSIIETAVFTLLHERP